jgi:RHS repeat-associated protein
MIEERTAAGALLWLRSLEYDADGRITRAVTFPSNNPAYNAVNKTDTATHDKDNRLATYNIPGLSTPVSFDPDGNLLNGPNAQGTAAASYQYDPHNRLTGVNGASLYRYNPDGHCVQDDTATYVIDPNASLPRILKRGSTCYIWGANGLEYEINGSATTTYHADHLGSTMLLTDSAGNVTAAYEYDSYGNTTYTTNPAATVFRWHGTLGVITQANGLINMRARMYNPRIMRFLNQDPIGFQGGMNWFAFVGGNPISRVDPLGLCATLSLQSAPVSGTLSGTGALTFNPQAVANILQSSTYGQQLYATISDTSQYLFYTADLYSVDPITGGTGKPLTGMGGGYVTSSSNPAVIMINNLATTQAKGSFQGKNDEYWVMVATAHEPIEFGIVVTPTMTAKDKEKMVRSQTEIVLEKLGLPPAQAGYRTGTGGPDINVINNDVDNNSGYSGTSGPESYWRIGKKPVVWPP